MQIDLNQQREIEKFIDKFKEEFYENFKINPVVRYSKTKLSIKLSVEEMIQAADNLVDLDAYPEGIRTKTRKRER